MQCNLAVIKGDGIGPEVVTEAMKVLDTVGKKFGHTFDYEQILMGGCSIDATGVPLTDEAVAVAKSKDAVLLGSIGGNTSTSFDVMNKYFGISQTPVAGSTYWNLVHGRVPGEAELDAEGMQTMRNLAKNLAWMLKCFEAGKAAGVALPDTERGNQTNFIR